MKKKIFFALAALVLLSAAAGVLYNFDLIPHRKYTAARFGIETYVSAEDMDADGIDDQTDILQSVRAYVGTEPKYDSRYYSSGYPDDGYGVCTDVVAFGLKGAGYDLMELVSRDIENNRQMYDIENVDKNIDFRRVRNLKVYFDNHAISLTTDVGDIEQWQGGDIVVFPKHIGVVSDMRNIKGIPFVIHHGSPSQTCYEQDILANGEDIIGHYRIS